MNKKLKLLGYVFNNFPVDDSDIIIDGHSMKTYLLEDDGVIGGIKEVINAQIDYNYWKMGGDTVSISGWATGYNE